ncbi:MAG: beta-propeller fold lactonase family protein, partial [Phycisphaerae bacterium]|nr:beta-propeller fold lactonase family protein [Phycisphaerae bacterium]
VAGESNGTVSVYDRDAATGLLTFRAVYRNGHNGVSGISHAESVVVSPDDQLVFVAGGPYGNSLAAFRRDQVTGSLTFLEAHYDNQDGFNGLGGPYALAISPDGRNLYTAAINDNAVGAFTLEFASGEHYVAVDAGEILAALDFGNTQLNSVAGQVFGDIDNNGQADPGEVGQDGWIVKLVAAATSQVVDTATTYALDLNGDGVIDPATESGLYGFEGILPGDYELRLVLQGGWDQTVPPGAYTVSLDRSHLVDMDFGVFLGANVFGQVFADRDLDGVHDVGDLGQDGWTVELLDAATGVTVATAATASEDLDGDGVIQADTESGLFHIGSLFADDYELRVVVPAGWSAIAPVGSHLFTLGIGEELAGLDFANIAYGDMEGQAFEDINGNAAQDAGEPGMNGWAIELVDVATGDLVATTVTADEDRNGDGAIDPAAEAGWYSFTHLPVAQYFVRQSSSPDYVQTLPGPVGMYGDLDVTVAANDMVSDVDFGVFVPAAAEGQVFADLNYDGLRDGDEDGLNGWTVELVNVGSGIIVGTAVTADVDVDGDGVIDPHTESGLYAFAGVLPGDHEIRLVLPELWSQTYPAGLAHSYLPLSGQTQSGLDFGVASLPSISGQVFYDSDGDGVHDGAENGLNGWTVELVDPATGDVLAIAVTADRDIDGSGAIDPIEERGTYRFTDLLPGEYIVRQTAQNGWIQTAPVTTTYTYTVDITQHETEGDFGNYQPSTVSGQKWHDLNADGHRDEGEVGLSGWTIELVDATTGVVVATTETADIDLNTDGVIDPVTEAGLYSFIDLPAGDYELREVPQAGWVQSWIEPLDVDLRVYNGATFLYDLETFTYYPYWLEGSHVDFNRDPGLWKVNDDVYAGGALDRQDMPQYAAGTDPLVYWFIFEDTRTGDGYWRAAGDRDFDDIDVKVVEDLVADTVEVTGYHKDSGYNFRLVAPDGTVYSESGSQIGPVSIDTFPLYGAHAWTFSLANDESIGDLNFSNFRGGGAVTGRHFSDTNANGVRDDGEVGLDGWTVE